MKILALCSAWYVNIKSYPSSQEFPQIKSQGNLLNKHAIITSFSELHKLEQNSTIKSLNKGQSRI